VLPGDPNGIGTTAVLAAAAAITLSAVPAPSALAQVPKASGDGGAKYLARSVVKLVSADGSVARPPVTVTGEFDPVRGSARRPG
jgi:hypothetical protein